MKIQTVYIGGWFQRTTLHLTEVADFLIFAQTQLHLSKERLTNYHRALEIATSSRENWLLEYVETRTKSGINFRYYEDGLIILEKKIDGNLKEGLFQLESYYDKSLSPAISYLFSTGAPVPKELAQMKTLLPFVITAKDGNRKDALDLFKDLGVEVYSEIETPYVQVYKGDKIILIISELSVSKIRQLVEGQIFFREFKSQLHRYLNIHRSVWEEIAAIKEEEKIPGDQVKLLRSKLDDYQKTVQLIDSRISQMGAYLKTRAKISTTEEVDKYLDKAFLFKFETLEDTLSYVQDLWKMTANYLESTLELFRNLAAESTKNSFSSLQLITTLGVVAGILGYLGKDSLPNITLAGAAFFVLLLVLTWLLNTVVSEYFRRKGYTIKSEIKHVFNIRTAKEEL